MLKDLGVLESTFGDIHKGVKFKISFFKYPNGYTIEVRVDGLPVRKDDDNCWTVSYTHLTLPTIYSV